MNSKSPNNQQFMHFLVTHGYSDAEIESIIQQGQDRSRQLREEFSKLDKISTFDLEDTIAYVELGGVGHIIKYYATTPIGPIVDLISENDESVADRVLLQGCLFGFNSSMSLTYDDIKYMAKQMFNADSGIVEVTGQTKKDRFLASARTIALGSRLYFVPAYDIKKIKSLIRDSSSAEPELLIPIEVEKCNGKKKVMFIPSQTGVISNIVGSIELIYGDEIIFESKLH